MLHNQLAFSTLGCPNWTWEQILFQAARMGFAAVEVRGVGSVLATDQLPCFLPENAAHTLALLEKHNLRLCVAGTSVSFHNPVHTAQALEEGRRAIDTCHRMGIPAIRVFGDLLPPDERREAVIARVVEGLTALCRYAEDIGNVKVLLEIHGDFNTIETISPVLEQMHSHPSFGIIWDVEHSFRAYGQAFEPFYRLIRPWINHVHIKDCITEGQNALVRMPGQGTVNLPQIIRQLQQDGYDGLYSFEWEKRWHPEIDEPEIAFVQYVRCMQKWLSEE